MITSKQRAYLRSMANSMETILIVGKSGVSTEVIKQADDALTAREIFKGKVLETAEDGVREIAAILAEKTQADIVQIIGTKFVLYRKNNKEPKITLPKK
ncbi:putative RNA-binding protein YhbY family [Clostridium sp. CAG:557]|jgi:RNA-binding protein|nr:putative RNA-binding protein YhbY family [Clostridium sp. CAG:557]